MSIEIKRGTTTEDGKVTDDDIEITHTRNICTRTLDLTLPEAHDLLAKLKENEYVPSTKELRKMMERTQVIPAAVPRKSRKTKTKR